MHVTYLVNRDGTYVIGIQNDEGLPHYYPALVLITEDRICWYPQVQNYDQIDPLLKLGLFKPPTLEQQRALFNHNVHNYHPSSAVKRELKPVPYVPALEKMAIEMTEMEKMGVAFSKK